jgi:hypothetical protein
MGAAKGYLLLYNAAQSVGWAVALAQTLLSIARDGSLGNAYAAAGGTVSEQPRPVVHAGSACHHVETCETIAR